MFVSLETKCSMSRGRWDSGEMEVVEGMKDLATLTGINRNTLICLSCPPVFLGIRSNK